MQKTTTIGFIGAGNMAYALISGLINNGLEASNIKLSDTTFDASSDRNHQRPAMSVRFYLFANTWQYLWFYGGISIVRTMPNTPALVGKGATGMVANDAVSDKQKTLAEQILGSVGEYFWVKEETMLDAVTALSGSGPAYFFLMIESMTNAGIALGLDKQIAEKLSIQTALGASTMSKQSTDSARELRAKVTSKNGTTQAAIESFQEQNFEIIISRAMRTAFERAREIGFELSDNA
jgi:pyrroline-5-carboxylate reductase